ncbi:hypothetical protein EKO04_003894 [Ascochyta lentis]|uniref:Uncharacterized protein n=1 Tax=Ascochyta lentis TaxID=205686 RepID=A0A8H7J8K5_9PLEO|nr:hypothetical protein EKO04_003894 [Ascochyta lentis]
MPPPDSSSIALPRHLTSPTTPTRTTDPATNPETSVKTDSELYQSSETTSTIATPNPGVQASGTRHSIDSQHACTTTLTTPLNPRRRNINVQIHRPTALPPFIATASAGNTGTSRVGGGRAVGVRSGGEGKRKGSGDCGSPSQLLEDFFDAELRGKRRGECERVGRGVWL